MSTHTHTYCMACIDVLPFAGGGGGAAALLAAWYYRTATGLPIKSNLSSIIQYLPTEKLENKLLTFWLGILCCPVVPANGLTIQCRALIGPYRQCQAHTHAHSVRNARVEELNAFRSGTGLIGKKGFIFVRCLTGVWYLSPVEIGIIYIITVINWMVLGERKQKQF